MREVMASARPRLARARSGSLLLGPAFVAAIAYVDPGNVASNISAGAQFGYLLVWVIVVANVMAGLVQFLSAKLGGVVTGRSLPETVRLRASRTARLSYWVQAEIVAMATDLAEVVGGAIALNLLFDLPLLIGGVITGSVSMVLLLVQDRRGQQPFERVIIGLLAVIAIGFLTSTVVAPPPPGGAVVGGPLAAVRWHGKRADRGRHVGCDGDASRGVSAFRSGAGSTRPSTGGGADPVAAVACDEDRCRSGDAAGGRGQPVHAAGGSNHFAWP